MKKMMKKDLLVGESNTYSGGTSLIQTPLGNREVSLLFGGLLSTQMREFGTDKCWPV